jgi:hypothetical protein
MLAYIPEVVMLYPSLTAVENLDFFSRLAGFNIARINCIPFFPMPTFRRTHIIKSWDLSPKACVKK